MQSFVSYVNACSTLGVVRDYTNSKNESAPVFTRGVSACLKLRLFYADESPDPYPLTQLQSIPSWQFVMDDDFDSTSAYILVADHENIGVSSVTETINETERTFTEVTIPIPDMNTEELNAILGTSESIATLNGELVGYDSDSNEVFVLQIKGFTVRNRISSTGNPTSVPSEYLTEAQVRALCSAGLDLIFAETASTSAADWHTTQTSADKYFRVRLKGDSRTWISGSAADSGWSDCICLLACGATNVSISDAGGYFTGSTVEAALQEIGAALAGTQ